MLLLPREGSLGPGARRPTRPASVAGGDPPPRARPDSSSGSAQGEGLAAPAGGGPSAKRGEARGIAGPDLAAQAAHREHLEAAAEPAGGHGFARDEQPAAVRREA